MGRRFEAPAWVADGGTVWIPWNKAAGKPGYSPEGTVLRCTVATAAGDHARVVNERYAVDRWYALCDLFVPEGDPQTAAATSVTVWKMLMARVP